MRKILSPVLKTAFKISLVVFALLSTNKTFADYTVASGNTVDASTITGQSGVLTINGTLTVSSNVFLSGFTSVIINGPTGKIFWSANKDLKFNAGVLFDIYTPGTTGGLQPTGQNAAMSLTIGSTTIAVSNDNSNNAAFSFAEFNGAGGLPKFTISSSPASPATICYGTSFTATITPTDNIVSFDCIWSVDNSGSITPASVSGFSTAQTASVTPTNSTTAKTYTITCKLYRAGDNDIITSKTVTVTVNPLPAVSAIAGGASSVCINAATPAFTDATSGGTWSITNGTGTATITAGGIVTGLTAGTVTVVYSYSNGTCSNTATKSLTVDALPTITGTLSVCAGSTTQLTGTATAAVSSPWISASTSIATVSTAGLVSGFAAGTSVITYTNTNGCSTTSTVTVNPLPTITPAVSTNNVCFSASAQTTSLTYSAANSPTTYSITWNAAAISAGFAAVTNASLLAGTVTIPVPASAPANIYTGTITVKNANGCTSSTGANFSVTINAVTVAGTLPSLSVCSAATGTLTLSGNTGNPVQWESSATGASPWSVISNTATSLSVSIAAQTTWYRVLVQSGACSSAYSSIATTGLHNVWTGVTSSDWNTASNWSDQQLPSTSCAAVTIPQVSSPKVFPVLSSGTSAINNLIINSNASLTISGGILQVGGSISNSGTFDASNGSIEFNGSAAQTISANTFQNNALKNLTVSNTAGTLNLAGTLDLYGTLSFTGTGKSLVTNNNLTLKSTASQTADVAAITTNGAGVALNFITGNVTVERFISAKRAWRYLSIPTNTSQTIKAAWQEGAVLSGSNPAPGYGTQITSNAAAWAANGFDYYSNDGASVKKYSTPAGYVGITNTTDLIATKEGLMTFVRGDRTAIGLYAGSSTTVLRTKGPLFTGTQPTITVNAGEFKSIGNPYAAPLDMRQITKTGVKDFFYVWDPNLGGTGGFGAYQTFSADNNGNYFPYPGGGSYGSSYNNYIQSGLAFFVAGNTSAGTVVLSESSKATAASAGSLLLYRPNSSPAPAQIRINLYALESNGNAALVDGAVSQFADIYSNTVNESDAEKISNMSENLSLKTNNKLLIIERRHTIASYDTINLNMFKMKVKSYRFEIKSENFDPSLIAFLEDSNYNTRIPFTLNGTSVYEFNVENIPASWNPSRFRIVFQSLSAALPLTFSSVKASQQNKNIAVEWKAENERNLKQYEVEKSVDGQHFLPVNVVNLKLSNSASVNYQWLDANAVTGNNYYRIKSVDKSGEIQYSIIVKVVWGQPVSQITVYPNPLINGNINLQLINQPKGNYAMRLINNNGQVMMTTQLKHAEGSSTEILHIDKNLAHGAYQLEITSPDNSHLNISMLH